MEPYFWPILLFLAGIALVGIEMFVPSGGLLGVLAALCFLGGIGLAFSHGVRSGLVMIIVSATVLPVLLATAVRIWPNTPIGRRILGELPEHPDEVLPDTEPYRGLKDLLGQRGQTGCKMLPGGTVVIDGRSFEAVTVGMALDERQVVEVVDIRMGRLVVRPLEGVQLPATLSAPIAGAPQATPPSDLEARPTSEDLLSRPIDSLGIEDPLA